MAALGESVAYARWHFVIERAEPHRFDPVRIVRGPQVEPAS